MVETPRGRLPRRVVVGTDLSPAGRVGLSRVRRLPLADGAHVVITVAVLAVDAPVLNEVARRLERERASLKRAFLAVGREDLVVRTSIDHGDAARAIPERAQLERADLVVVGRRGEGARARRVFGSTVERMLQSARVPMLVVGKPARRAYRRALVAVDATPRCSDLLHLVAALIPDPPASLTAFSACVFPIHTSSPLLGISRADAAKLRQEEMLRVGAQLERLVEPLRRSGLAVNLVTREYDPRTELPKVIRRLRPDLVAVGSSGRAGLARVLLGTTFQDVLASTTADVLVGCDPET